jgi:hypothetical protein
MTISVGLFIYLRFMIADTVVIGIPILRFQVRTILDLNEQFRAQVSDEIAHEIWSEENARELLEEISSLASQHISKVRIIFSSWWAILDTMLTRYAQSHEVWEPWIHWELERLEELATLAETDPMKMVEKGQATVRIDEMFLSRLKQPHSSTSLAPISHLPANNSI